MAESMKVQQEYDTIRPMPDTLLSGVDSTVAQTVHPGFVEGIPLARDTREIGFMPAMLLVMVAYYTLLTFLRFRGGGIFPALFRAFFRRKDTVLIRSGEQVHTYLFLLLAVCLSFVSLALLAVYLLRSRLVLEEALLFFIALLAIHVVVTGVISLLGWTFNGQKCAREMILNLWTFNAVWGMALSPLVFSLFFVSSLAGEALTTLLSVLTFAYLCLRIFRWIKILFQYRVSIFHIILYLCALEILPVLLLYKQGVEML